MLQAGGEVGVVLVEGEAGPGHSTAVFVEPTEHSAPSLASTEAAHTGSEISGISCRFSSQVQTRDIYLIKIKCLSSYSRRSSLRRSKWTLKLQQLKY